jgi:hypothetical protein
MAIDGRLASATCNLGPLIEADAAASDALQGTGVIRWKGSVKIKGLINPTAGATVTISDIPKRFRVMSHFADPMVGVTTVEIGCTLSFLSNRKPKIENPTAAEENPEVPCAATRAGAFPSITAQYVFNQCVSALGISSSGASLTNTFAIKEFDLSGGYISAISDLLSSETQIGEMDASDVLRVRNLSSVSGGGPRFSEADLISIGPVGSGNLPGDAVAVRYSTRRLKEPEPAADPEDPEDEEAAKDEDKRAWEYSKSEFIGETIQLKQGIDETGAAADISYTNYQISETVTEYDVLDRVIKRTTTAQQPLGQANGTFAQSAFLPTTRTIGPSPTETVPDEWTKIVRGMVSLPVQTIDVEIIQYEYDAPPAEDDPDDTILDCEERAKELLPKDAEVDLSKIKLQETYRYESECALLGALGYSGYLADYSRYRTNGGSTRNPADISLVADKLTQKTETTYESAAVNIDLTRYGVGSSTQLPGAPTSTENTRSTVTKYLAYAFTQQGQQMASRRLIDQLFQFNNSITTDVLPAALELIKVETSQESVIGREYGLQTRPSAADRSNQNNDKGASNPETIESGEPTIESVEEIEFVSGASSSQNVVEFTLPLAPDDRMSWNGTSWTSTPTDAAAKARNYGRVQNRLLLGNRAGMEIQVLPARVPDMAGDGIAISMGGLTAQYLVNNLSYVINADGMVASVNACFWGALGATPEFNLVNAWTPTAPGLTALPTPPAVTGGTTITTPTGGTVVSGGTVGTGPIYPPFNEVVFLTGVVRARTIWTRRTYALTLPTRTMDVVLKVLTPPAPPPPSPEIIAATYSQSSVYSGNTAADATNMTNGIYAETTATGTNSANPAWVKMNFSSAVEISQLVIGSDYDNTLAGGWGASYAQNKDIQVSEDDSTWITVGSTGTFSAGIKTIDIGSYLVQWLRVATPSSQFLALTELYCVNETMPLTWQVRTNDCTYSLSNRKLTADFETNAGFTRSLAAHSDGKWYAEIVLTDGDGDMNEIIFGLSKYGNTWPGNTTTEGLGTRSGGTVQFNDAGATVTGTMGTIADGDTVMIAVDFDAKKAWFGINGTWQNSGDPVAGTGFMASAWPGSPMWAIGLKLFFGNSAAELPTTPAYTPPSGFTYWG